uniref:CSON005023 protein n=1 Tax=Culicoides sonorensis TaxID=179676 RepID=A0A336M6K3_CULSO
MNIYVHVIPFYIDIFYRIYCSLFQFNSIILHKRFSFKMKRFSNLMDIAEVSPNQIILKDSKVKKPYESFLSSRVSSKFNRKCIKLKLKEKLLERKMKSDSDSGEKTDRVNDISENTASPLTQLANAFGGICTFQTPTSTRQSESRASATLEPQRDGALPRQNNSMIIDIICVRILLIFKCLLFCQI